MRRLRSVIFWLHLAAGVTAGAVILIMSVTGVLLTYQRQITAWADARGLDGAPPHAGAPLLPPAALIDAAGRVRSAEPTAIRWRNDPDAPTEIVFGREGTLFMNAYTGAVLGSGSERTRAFFRTVTDWHRWLAGQGEARERGRAITGAANLAFLFIILSGLWLWWPRNWSPAALRNVLWFRRGLRPKARDFNWHNVVGFWTLLPMAIVVGSGVVISYPWATSLVYRAVGDEPPAPRGSAGGRAGGTQRTGDDDKLPSIAYELSPGVLAGVMKHEDWRSLTLQLAPAEGGGASVAVDRGDGGQPQLRSQLVLDANTGVVVKTERFADGSPGRRARSLLRFAHTGEVAGIVGQTVAGLVSLAAVVLVFTGIALSVRRLGAAWKRRNPRQEVTADEVTSLAA